MVMIMRPVGRDDALLASGMGWYLVRLYSRDGPTHSLTSSAVANYLHHGRKTWVFRASNNSRLCSRKPEIPATTRVPEVARGGDVEALSRNDPRSDTQIQSPGHHRKGDAETLMAAGKHEGVRQADPPKPSSKDPSKPSLMIDTSKPASEDTSKPSFLEKELGNVGGLMAVVPSLVGISSGHLHIHRLVFKSQVYYIYHILLRTQERLTSVWQGLRLFN